MKIKLNKVYNHLLVDGFNLQRKSNNVINVSKENTSFDIILPMEFDIEKEALNQFISFANFTSPSGKGVKCACATPDFHKGSLIPIGSVVVTDHDLIIPAAIGTDINCGMRMHNSGLYLNDFLLHKKEILSTLRRSLLEGQRNMPVTGKSMSALFSYGIAGFVEEIKKTKEGIFQSMSFDKIEQELNLLHDSAFLLGNEKFAPESLQNREVLRDPGMGTIGGGNHFVEFQVIKEIKDKKAAYHLGLKPGMVVYMIHTGSRDVGFYVGNRWVDKAKDLYPKGIKHPKDKIYALEGQNCEDYLSAMHSAAHYATLNRLMLAEMIREKISLITKIDNNNLITDVPHNICLKEDIGNVHRKGATPAYKDQLLLIPGSMGHDSYLLRGLGNEKWLSSASHGAGRVMSRGKISYEAKKNKSILGLDGIECITLKEERLIEEAPGAYKDISKVISSQTDEGIADVIAIMSPLVTFKG